VSKNKTLEAADRKIFTTYFDDGLLDFALVAFVLMFVLAPFLSIPLGDFWASAVFLPFWGVVYLILGGLRKHIIRPRLGSVEWGATRKKKLRTGTIVLLIINVIFLVLGAVFASMPISSGMVVSILFAMMMLILFSTGGYILGFNVLYVYGALLALALPVGEWLFQNYGFSHHGYPVAFGTLAVIMFVRGLYKFITFMKETPYPPEEQMG
jgi:MFS family permease